MKQAIVTGAFTLGAVVLTFLGTTWMQVMAARRADRAARRQAIAEMLTSVADLLSGIRMIRGAYQHQTRWRHYVRVAGTVLAAIGAVLLGQPGSSPTRDDWAALLDVRASGPVISRLLELDSALDASLRTLALDLTGILLPRVTRFYSALSVVTLGADDRLADAARDLASDVGDLLENMAASARKFSAAERRAQRALGQFRDAADKSRR
ncbi:MAG: hypothetical protein ACYCVZ_00740 [Streptosporangiaceae bacterium]